MKIYDASFILMLGLLAAAAALSLTANSYFDLEEDNIAEEFVEELIESNTGLDIDLSPSSPEN